MADLERRVWSHILTEVPLQFFPNLHFANGRPDYKSGADIEHYDTIYYAKNALALCPLCDYIIIIEGLRTRVV